MIGNNQVIGHVGHSQFADGSWVTKYDSLSALRRVSHPQLNKRV